MGIALYYKVHDHGVGALLNQLGTNAGSAGFFKCHGFGALHQGCSVVKHILAVVLADFLPSQASKLILVSGQHIKLSASHFGQLFGIKAAEPAIVLAPQSRYELWDQF